MMQRVNTPTRTGWPGTTGYSHFDNPNRDQYARVQGTEFTHKNERASVVFGEPVEGRESAARRWRFGGQVTLIAGLVGGSLAAVGVIIDLPDGTVLLGLTLLAVALIGAFVCTVGIGRTRDIPWHRSLWLGLKAMGAAVKDFF